ncbi:MAG: AhpC/TSA family protein [Bacteroidales bacterium]|nr:AhpC/TSA family protein [Bacteroidales bacterium]
MKKSIIYLVAAVLPLICASCAKKNVISGQLDGLGGDSLRVEIYDVTNQRTPINSIDVLTKDGKFSCEIPETEVRGLLLVDPASGLRAPLVFVPGEYAKIGGRLDSLVVLGGSEFYKDQNEYETLCAEDRLKLNEIIAEYRALPQTATDAAKDAVMEKYDAVNDHIASLTKDFITRKPASLFSATLVNHLVGDDGKDALDVLELIPDNVKEGPMKVYLDQASDRANKAKARAEAAEKVKDGMAAPVFTLKNEKGEDFTLSSIYNKGKYIILDFWGEWCYWCKKGIPDMKQLYKDAKGKIEILSIDCGDTEEVWKKAIVDHELPWLHVYNPNGTSDGVPLSYAVTGYPTKIILNPDGTINKTIVGEDPEFYDYVKSLIKK